MPTNLAIDDEFLEAARLIGGRRTKRETVNDALAEYIQRRKQLAAIKVFGSIDFDREFNYKKARTKR